jgi:hypothetical protein
MGPLETRLNRLENRFEQLLVAFQLLTQAVRAADQTAKGAYGQWQPQGSATGAVYFCYPTTLTGATGIWPSLTPTSQSLTVYQVTGTTIASLGTFTVYNWYPAAPAASKVCEVAPDGAGNFVTVAQSCT